LQETIIKFGGSSVSTAANINLVADIIVRQYMTRVHGYLGIEELTGYRNVNVVVSALGKTPGSKEKKITDHCLNVVQAVKDKDSEAALRRINRIRRKHYVTLDELRFDKTDVRDRLSQLEELVTEQIRASHIGLTLDECALSDSVVSIGELLSTPIVAEVVQQKLAAEHTRLRQKKERTELELTEQHLLERLNSCDGKYVLTVESGDAGFVTDSKFTKAELLEQSLRTDIARYHKELREQNPHRLIFYPGFVAKDEEGRRTTLGRDGSNVTTIALAVALKVSQPFIYSDADGVLIADPKLLGGAQTVRQISRREVATLGSFGGMPVIKQEALDILERNATCSPVVKNTFNPDDPGTTITSFSTSSRSRMKGIGVLHNIAYREFDVKDGTEFDLVRRTIQEYDGARLLYSKAETTKDGLLGTFVIQTTPKEGRDNKTHFGTNLVERINETTERTGEQAFDPAQIAHYPDCSLVSVCGEKIGHAYKDYLKFVAETLVRDGKLAPGFRRVVPFIPPDHPELLQVVVPTDSIEDIIRCTYNKLKKINVILFGAGKVGLRFLEKALESYDKLGINVVGVADSTGVLSKIGGFSEYDLGEIIHVKRKEQKSFSEIGEYRSRIFDLVYLDLRDIRSVQGMEKGDFVFVDATNNSCMADVQSYALALGMDVVSVNKTPCAMNYNNSVSAGQKTNEWRKRSRSRRLLNAVFDDRVHIRGTVGANLGATETLMDLIKDKPRTIHVQGVMSGTLGYTLSELEQGKKLSEVITTAIEQGYTEPKPYDDYSGRDVLNKAIILWRIIATRYGVGFSACNIEHESFIQPIIDAYERDSGITFDLNSITSAKGADFAKQIEPLDSAFEKLKTELPKDKSLCYIAEVHYDDKLKRGWISVGLQEVHKENPFYRLQATDNLFLFNTDGKQYTINPGPGAGIEETSDALMRDLEHFVAVHRGEKERVVHARDVLPSEKGPKQRTATSSRKWYDQRNYVQEVL